MTTTPPGQRLLMAAAIIVATAAGIVGAIMLIAPSSTGRYFAWPLGPRALAALVGGFSVVSAPALIAYGIGGLPVAALHPDALGPGAAGYVAGLLIVVAVPALALARGARG